MILVLLAGWALRQTTNGAPSLLVYQHEPQGIMGTRSKLVAVVKRDRLRDAQQGLEAAEAELRRLEALLSTWIEPSQISRFNDAPADQPIALADELVEVLTAARELYDQTSGVFDITARPLIELWRRAGNEGLLPSKDELAAARAASRWDDIRFEGEGVSKSRVSTRVDIDGIAKGYAIDRALLRFRREEAEGGMVEVGGDLRVFGLGPEERPWIVAIRSPFEDSPWAEIELDEGAVCSSGDYARSIEIDGRRFSHIIDPRTGWPAEEIHSVTVVAPDAATADAWATALSILGVSGFDLLPATDDLHAMIVTGGPDDYQVSATPGFRRLLVWAVFDLSE